MRSKQEYTISSGNIFRDAKIPNPDIALAKAKLILQIDKLIEEKGLTQKEAAKLLGTTQSKISALLRGRLSSFTFDLLFIYLNKLSQNIEISTSLQDLDEPVISVIENRISAR